MLFGCLASLQDTTQNIKLLRHSQIKLMMSYMLLKQLEQNIDRLINDCERLKYDNQQLRKQHSQCQTERDILLKKASLARTRIESMIGRLKILESDE